MNRVENAEPMGGMFIVQDASFWGVFTPEDFSPEHKDIAKAAESFVTGEILARAEEIETLNYELSRQLLRKAGELGFLGIDLPEKYGGMELDKISSAIVSEKLGYGAGSFVVTESNHTGIGTFPLALFGTEKQKEKYLPGLVAGTLAGCFGLTESRGGSDALNPLTRATLTADGKYYILNGAKQFITNSGFADLVFVYAKVDGKFFTAFIVEQKSQGVSLDEEEEKMGYHGTSTRAYHFDNVKVPVENVLGEVGRGHLVALNALNMGRYKMGATSLGQTKRAFLEAVRYAKQRVLYGKPICELGLIKEKIGAMATRIYAAESLIYRTGGLIQAGLDSLNVLSGDGGAKEAAVVAIIEAHAIECSINKIYGTEAEDYVIDEELQIFGGYGYIRGNHAETAYRNTRINRIWEGTNEVNRLVIANTLNRILGDGKFDLSSVSGRVDKMEPVDSDESGTLDPQERLVRIAKACFVMVFRRAREKFGIHMREKQEILGLIGDMIIEIYAMESALLRSQKMLSGKNFQRASIPVEMTKVLFHDSVEKVGFFARSLLEVIEEGRELRELLSTIRNLMAAPPINVVALRRNIADHMIEFGRYDF